MVKRTVTIKNPTGLTLKPSEYLSKVALRFQAHTGFEYEGGTANVKSILSVLGAGVKCGDEIVLFCSGKDENQAINALADAVGEGLGE